MVYASECVGVHVHSNSVCTHLSSLCAYARIHACRVWHHLGKAMGFAADASQAAMLQNYIAAFRTDSTRKHIEGSKCVSQLTLRTSHLTLYVKHLKLTPPHTFKTHTTSHI